jgi:hypothetical protein
MPMVATMTPTCTFFLSLRAMSPVTKRNAPLMTLE